MVALCLAADSDISKLNDDCLRGGILADIMVEILSRKSVGSSNGERWMIRCWGKGGLSVTIV